MSHLAFCRILIRSGFWVCLLALPNSSLLADDDSGQRHRAYDNRVTPVVNPKPLLADHPEFVEPIREAGRFEAPMLVDDKDADLDVRAWRFSYNARGIIEMPNRLRAEHTAVIVVHPWGIDDGRGWKTPEPAGVAFACTPEKNRICREHMKQVVDPFLKSLRGKVGLVAYSLPGSEDPIRKKIYRSIRATPTEDERQQGLKELESKLQRFSYQGQPLPEKVTISSDRPTLDYFRQFPGLDAGAKFNKAGFWDLPIPVAKPIKVDPKDVVIYDPEGYEPFKQFLQKQGIRHILLAGYHADMCVCKTTAGYQNLSRDFDVFLVGDAMLATFPAAETPRFAPPPLRPPIEMARGGLIPVKNTGFAQLEQAFGGRGQPCISHSGHAPGQPRPPMREGNWPAGQPRPNVDSRSHPP